MTKLAIFSTKKYDIEYFNRWNSGEFEIEYFDVALNPSSSLLCEGFDAVCIFVNDVADGETLKRLKVHGIKILALRCAGYNNVDLDAAEREGITVVRVPAYSPEAIAEHTLALILTLNRKIHKAYNRVRENNFSLENLVGFNLQGKTVGIIGTGRIGQAFARILMGLGCEILAYDIHENEELKIKGVKYVSLDELLKDSKIVSLHCPLLPSTRKMIGSRELSMMQEGSMLINTSRGALIDTKEVIKSLKSKKLGALGLDVYEQEENLFFHDHSGEILEDDIIARLLTFPNVLVTSHQGFLTEEALNEIVLTTFKNILEVQEGKECINKVKKL